MGFASLNPSYELRRPPSNSGITDLPDVSSPLGRKYFAKDEIIDFRFSEIYGLIRASRFLSGGAFGQSPQTLERDAMDAEVSPGVRSFRGRAKPRGPDSPTLESSLPEMAGDGGYQARHSGESAE
jgi:hypothetical protein